MDVELIYFLLWLQNLVSKLNDPAFRRGAAPPRWDLILPGPFNTQEQCSIFERKGADKGAVGWLLRSPSLEPFQLIAQSCLLLLAKVSTYASRTMQRKGAWRKGNLLALKFHFTSLWASLVVQMVQNPPAMQETWVWSLDWEDPLEKGMVTHSSILAWRIAWTEEYSRLQSMGSQRVGHDWATFTYFSSLCYKSSATVGWAVCLSIHVLGVSFSLPLPEWLIKRSCLSEIFWL